MLKLLRRLSPTIHKVLRVLKIYTPSFFKVSHDGGKGSGVTGYWLIEWKPVFSIVLLKFNKGSREAYHEHAFSAWTFWLNGEVVEKFKDGNPDIVWKPSFKPKYTARNCYHKIDAQETSWALSFRGRWKRTWKESRKDGEVTLTHGRNIVDEPERD